ncbi:hypothetical protein [Nocardia sp. NPDC048505]|uniref:hypothetical protein n=1 Tax=unclassified Nocardia TaxID=2637762 RepID=UPI003410CDEB
MTARIRLRTLLVTTGVVVLAIPLAATLAFAAGSHPECASIPGDVGPCGYWARLAEFGPFVMLYGTTATAGLAATVWLLGLGVFGLIRVWRGGPGRADGSEAAGSGDSM